MFLMLGVDSGVWMRAFLTEITEWRGECRCGGRYDVGVDVVFLLEEFDEGGGDGGVGGVGG